MQNKQVLLVHQDYQDSTTQFLLDWLNNNQLHQLENRLYISPYAISDGLTNAIYNANININTYADYFSDDMIWSMARQSVYTPNLASIQQQLLCAAFNQGIASEMCFQHDFVQNLVNTLPDLLEHHLHDTDSVATEQLSNIYENHTDVLIDELGSLLNNKLYNPYTDELIPFITVFDSPLIIDNHQIGTKHNNVWMPLSNEEQLKHAIKQSILNTPMFVETLIDKCEEKINQSMQNKFNPM